MSAEQFRKPIKICKETADFIRYTFKESIEEFGKIIPSLIVWAREYAKSDSEHH